MKVIIILLSFLLFGCEEKTKEYIEISGKIIHKEYKPAKSTTVLIPIFIEKTSVLVPTTKVIPEKYILTAEIPVRKNIEVSKEEYEKYIIGNEIIIKEVKE